MLSIMHNCSLNHMLMSGKVLFMFADISKKSNAEYSDKVKYGIRVAW